MPTATPTPVQLRRPAALSAAEVDALNALFEAAHPTEIIRWATGTFGDELCLTTSFSDTLLIDLAVAVDPDIEVVFLDTGLHFAETLATLRRAMVRYELNLRVERPDPDAPDLFEVGTEACCASRKVAPLERALAGRRAWLSGLRRDDHVGRSHTPIIQVDRRGLVKVNPLAAWPAAEADAYVAEHGIVLNPLLAEGFGSVGCWPCTELPTPGSDARSGRWADSAKTECGIHL
ncbi:MAG: phosphoadenylyl-sulfate reductase [Actinobacteria bacterium]|nr:phosphoadenylyl-sulfate reductase [Actinomycetota bacterium]